MARVMAHNITCALRARDVDKNSSQYLAAVQLKVNPKPTLTEQRVPICPTLPSQTYKALSINYVTQN